MSLSSFRVHQDATGQQSSAPTEKVTNTHRRANAVGCRCHRSACTKTRPDIRVMLRRKKVTNTRTTRVRGDALGCHCHRSACTKTRPDSRVVRRRKKSDEDPPLSGAVECRCVVPRALRRDRTSE
ncbi:hypothetical protein TNCV_1998911 [Trichonephila clavipes]|nr:hypothetical protein TNCV_1998911 [Trichonephila clavipes]